MLVQHVESAPTDFSCVRSLVYGASPIAEDVLVRAMHVFPNAGFRQVYGSTESAAVATFSTPDLHDLKRGKLRSCGRPYPGIGLRVVDPNGQNLPAGEVGEIVIRGPCVMKGIWKNPEATREAFFEGGWLRSGDAGYFDDEGFLYIHDRVKDMIITGAENVYPAEVENALFGHPAVADVAVIGVPDPRWGEAVKAIIVLRPGKQATPEDIIAYTRERIAGYKLPKSIDFIAALPRNPTGKVLRRELRAPYWRDRDRQVG
jgi:fatty-acyl-CoA synthase